MVRCLKFHLAPKNSSVSGPFQPKKTKKWVIIVLTMTSVAVAVVITAEQPKNSNAKITL